MMTARRPPRRTGSGLPARRALGGAPGVARALESVAAEDEHGQESPGNHHTHLRSGRVHDMTTTNVATADETTSSKKVVRILAGQKVNELPVMTKEDHVAGMVSAADLLCEEERNFRRPGTGPVVGSSRERAQAEARLARELMTSLAITTRPHAPAGTARLMNGHWIRRLPVGDSLGKLIGIVSRRDLFSVIVRPDKEIAAEVHGVLTGVLFAEPHGAEVTVSDGMVTLSGTLPRPDLIPVAERLASEVDGVVAVTCKLTGPSRTPQAGF